MKKLLAVKVLRLEAGLKLVNGMRWVPRRPDEVLVQVIAAGICKRDLEIVRKGMRHSEEHSGTSLLAAWRSRRTLR